MNTTYALIRKFFTPMFWLSLLALVILIFIYNYYNLSLQSIKDYKGYLFILVMICFLPISFFYNLLIHYKNLSSIREIIKKTVLQIIEFFIKCSPYFILLYIYDSIHGITPLLNNNEFDDLLVKIDRFLLGGKDIGLIFEKLIFPWLTSWLALAYNFYFIFFLINPIIYFFLKDKKAFDIVLSGVMVSCYLGLIIYILVPCVGPLLYQQDLFSKELIMLDGRTYSNSDSLLANYHFSRNSFHCFPSLHFAVPMVWLYYAWCYWRKNKLLKYIYYLHIPLIISLWFSTLYLRWHYLFDLIAGLPLAIFSIWLAAKINNWREKKFSNETTN